MGYVGHPLGFELNEILGQHKMGSELEFPSLLKILFLLSLYFSFKFSYLKFIFSFFSFSKP